MFERQSAADWEHRSLRPIERRTDEGEGRDRCAEIESQLNCRCTIQNDTESFICFDFFRLKSRKPFGSLVHLSYDTRDEGQQRNAKIP